jgi:hypothetical protein
MIVTPLPIAEAGAVVLAPKQPKNLAFPPSLALDKRTRGVRFSAPGRRGWIGLVAVASLRESSNAPLSDPHLRGPSAG